MFLYFQKKRQQWRIAKAKRLTSISCLIYGKTEKGRDLHVQISLPPIVVVITTYEPDPAEWINSKIRR